MANEADGPEHQGRTAAGTARNANDSSRQGGDEGKSGASVTKGKANTTRSDEDRGGDNASRQKRSGHSSSDDGANQQPGRKKRRWRSRRKKGNRPEGTNAQQGPLPENGTMADTSNEGTHSANGTVASKKSSSNLSDTHSQRGSNRPDRRPASKTILDGQDDDQSARSDGSRPDDRKGRGRRRSGGSQQDRTSSGSGNSRQSDRAPQGRPKSQRDGSKGPQGTGQARNSTGQEQQGRQSSSSRQPRHPARFDGSQGRTSYAALDLGTNNCRLLVAEPHGQSFRVVDAFSRIVRLGEGLSQSGRLSDDAQERAIAALKVCQSKLVYRKVKRFRLIATEACRRAANGGAFLHRVYKETGLKLEIVNRETEARLAVAGCASLVHPEAEGVVLFDIGGGSSEVVWLDLDPMVDDGMAVPGEKRNRQTRRAMRHLSERIRCWTSLQVGVVTLSEKHGGKFVGREEFEAMVAEVREMLHEFEEREALAKAIQSKHIHMLGTSGTVTTLAGVHLGLERYDRRQVDGTWLSDQELRSMINRILEMNFDERIKNPCIGQDRADLVLAGCAILEAFHREWPVSRLRVADRGLREGILTEMMIDDGVWNPQMARKKAGKNRRPRRRGSRGHRGQGTGKQPQGEKS